MAEQIVAVVDTDVFSTLYFDPNGAAQRGLPVDAWRDMLIGVRVVISFQTRAEVLAGLLGSNWGERKLADARLKLDAAPTIPADRQVIDVFAELTANCRRSGHALHDKIHTGDRWVAACAVAKDLPLLSRDGIYRDAPGVRLLD